jgi:hypothetical protein
LADDVTIQNVAFGTPLPGTVVATDNIGGRNFQRVKVCYGPDGTATDVASGFGLPVAQDGAWAITITSGTVTANQGGSWTVAATQSGTWNVANTGTFAVQAAQSGTWNLGTVTTVTTVSAVTAITNALPAGTNTLGKTYTALQTTKALTNANVSLSSSGENTIVAGTASQTIRVFAGSLTAASAVTLTIKDAASGTTLATIPLTANGSFSFDTIASGEPLFVTASSGAFIISLGSAVSVTGFVQYIKS